MQLQRSLLVALAGFGARASQCARVAARRTNAAHVDAQQATWMLSDVPRRQASVVAAAAAAGGDDLDKFLNAIPPESHGLAIKFISGLQQQVADKSAELAAKSDEAERLAMELEATKKKLQTTQRTLLLSFSVAGVVDARSFLEHVVKIWEAEGTPGAPAGQGHYDTSNDIHYFDAVMGLHMGVLNRIVEKNNALIEPDDDATPA
ncbi:hypothetical protein CHLRE_07g331114v5 [Chlamydomonas reinhardtii]|uniref:Uncharacterized protein n=1 Tax=Chlamydomonas reinhardtii TaxID=3055 RepID=A0A2K3DJW3_CHLRE|nr:uncharacterized protein CHLRE_07g331114v5 [Chlamydomonas reinhardtii]PNW80826.1 hypothetical protein CHLRE_07g331114v5 [Chlamydomonas reinhardtii]